MAIGIFRKIGDFAKKIFSKGKEVIGRLLPVAANVASMIPHPAAQMIGTGLNIANQTLGNLMDNTGFGNSSTIPSLPGSAPEGTSNLLHFNKI